MPALSDRARTHRLRAVLVSLVAAVSLVTVGAAQTSAQTYPPNPFAGKALYVDPYSQAAQDVTALSASNPTAAQALRAISTRPSADWFGDWNAIDSVRQDVDGRVDAIAAAGAYPVLVVYNIPKRDCGSYSGGGATSPDAYRAWIDAFKAGIGTRPAAVILEPDGIALVDCLTPQDQTTRFGLIDYAIRRLAAGGNVAVYVDAGHAGWVAPAVMAQRLAKAGVVNARGFSLNVSNFGVTADQIAYGKQIAPTIGWKRFVVDTSRNGLGAATGIPEAWCNPPGRGLGTAPTASTGDKLVDAFLWIKRPGESDGTCNGGPPAGTWWRDYAVGLSQRAS